MSENSSLSLFDKWSKTFFYCTLWYKCLFWYCIGPAATWPPLDIFCMKNSFAFWESSVILILSSIAICLISCLVKSFSSEFFLFQFLHYFTSNENLLLRRLVTLRTKNCYRYLDSSRSISLQFTNMETNLPKIWSENMPWMFELLGIMPHVTDVIFYIINYFYTFLQFIDIKKAWY